MAEMDTTELTMLALDLAKAGARTAFRAANVVRHHGMRLQAQVKANAAGRPGPRIQHGDYNRSIGLQFGFESGAPIARVGTNRPQGRRLEKGFVGTDSLGRAYNQPPFPHFGPAVDKVGEEFYADVLELGAQVLGK